MRCGFAVRLARLGGAAACLLAAVVLFSPATAAAATEIPTQPEVQSAEVNGATLTLTFSGKSWNDTTPAPSRFSVAGTDNGPTTVTDVAISEDRFKVMLSLSPAVQNGDTGVRVSYARGNDANPLQNGAGKAPDFSNRQVTNSTPAGADTTAPAVASATVNGSVLELTFNEAKDPTNLPLEERFSVAGTSSATAVTGVSFPLSTIVRSPAILKSTTLRLTVRPAVTAGDTGITVSYARGTEFWANPLRDSAGNTLPDFSGQQVTNNTPAPRVSGGWVEGSRLMLWFSDNLAKSKGVPAGSRFTVAGTPSATTVTGVTFHSDFKESPWLELAVSPAVPKGDTGITVSYTQGDDANPLKDPAGSKVADFSGLEVVNTAGVPTVARAQVDGSTLALDFTRFINGANGLPAASRFTVAGTASATTVTGVKLFGSHTESPRLELAVSPAVRGGDTGITVSYTQGDDAKPLKDTAGSKVADFSGQAVTNNTPAAALAASFHGLPKAHDSSRLFGFEIRFDETVPRLKLTSVESALTVTGGRLIDVKHTVRGKNDKVTVRVRPAGTGALMVALAATEDCSAAGAICGRGGSKLAAVSATVPGPADTTPPAPVSATADGRIVTVTFDEDLAEPASTEWFNFEWTVDGTGSRHHPERAWFADRRTVLLELAASFPAVAGQTVTVSYAASDFLRDAAGNRVADFTMTAAVAGPAGNAPATGAPSIAGTAEVGETLTASTGSIADADGLTRATFAFQWVSSRDGADTDIGGATASSYTLAAADAGAAIKVRVSFTDDGGNAEMLMSAATAGVAEVAAVRATGAADSAPPAPVSATADGRIVTVTFDEDLAEPASTEWFNFEWTVDGTGFRHHPERAWFADRRTVSLELAASFPAKAGQTVTVSYAASDFLRDAAGKRVADFSMTAAVVNAPATGAPSIAGTEKEGETLVASTDAIADADGLTGAVFAFQWVSSRDGADTDIAGATASSYTLATADVGAAIKVRVSFTDDGGFSEALTSAATAAVAPRPPLTATFHGVPARHDGSEAFSFEVRFSEEVRGLPGVFAAGGLHVDIGRVVIEIAKRTASGGYRSVKVVVEPTSSFWDLTLTLPATTDCAAVGAICTADGRKLSNTVTATLEGPLAAILQDVPNEYPSGEPFWFKVRFSKEFRGLRLEAFAAGALQVENGQLVEVAQTVPGENRSVTVWVMPTSWRDVTLTLPATTDCAAAEAICMVDGRKLVNTSTATVKRPTPLTAALHRVPEAHDGSEAFDFEVRFNQEFRGLRLEAFAAGALQVENGRVVDAKQAVEGENRSINVRVRPDGYQDVTLTLARPTDCGAAGAICPMDGHKLSNTSTATVRGPITISVADAEADEAAGATIEFTVTLSRAAPGPVTVDYATSDGTATAGEDYTAASGTLTFAAGVLAQTVAVALLDDAIDEGRETFTLTLSNPSGAVIADGEAVGTIINTDQMPKAWNARFGRAVAVHVVEAVEARLEGQGDSFVQVGGHRLGGAAPDVLDSVQGLAPGQDPGSSPRQVLFAAGEAGEAAGEGAGNGSGDLAGQHVTFRDLLLGSAFHLVSEPGERPGAPRLSAWGRVATSGFDAVEDKLSLNGTVTTATLGVDGVWKRWLTGLLLAYSEGDGSFSHAELPGGEVASTLTSLHPYAAYRLTDRVRLWGTVGYGSGALRLTLENGPGTEEAERRVLATDLAMTMGALGARGELLRGARGLELALRSDVLWMAMDSAAAPDLGATTAEVSRLRLVLEGSRPVSLGGGGMVTPTLQIGLRHDGGDAETGTGVEVGAGLRYATAWGLSVEASARTLVAHEAEDYREWGASGALRYDPGRQGLGLTASLAPTWGTAGSGVEHLWGLPGGAGLGVPGGGVAPAGRLDAELGYGLAALRGRGLLTPYARVALTEGADQAWHLGARLAVAESLNLSLEASRRAAAGAAAAHDLALLATLGF